MKIKDNFKPIHIVVLCWNAVEYTKKFFDSMYSGLRKNDVLCFINNGSTDDTKNYLRKLSNKYSNVIVYHNEENLGFTKGVNQGVSKIKKGYDLLLLNNDLEEFPDNWLNIIQSQMYFECSKDTGILGIKQFNYDGNGDKIIIHHGAFTLRGNKQGWPYYCGQKDINQCERLKECEHVNFAFAYIKQEVVEKTIEKDGFFLDEIFHSYCEDDDFCLRARLNGWKIFSSSIYDVRHHSNVSTKENNVSQPELQHSSMLKYSEKWKEHYDSLYFREVSIQTLAGAETGYAKSGRSVLKYLDLAGIKTNYSYIFGTKYSEPNFSDKYAEDIRWNRQAKRKGIQISLGQGDAMNKNSGEYRIGFTMLETTDVPKDWVEQINDLDELWVPSNFNKSTFEESGVKVPIFVMPLGIDSEYLHPNIISYHKKYDMKYNFLSVGEWGERKNFLPLVQTFVDAFSREDEIGLSIRYSNYDNRMDPPVRKQLLFVDYGNNRAPVRMIKEDILEQQANFSIDYYRMGSLYTYFDAYVSMTSGEGFGLPIFEALACGLPVLVTGWSAFVEHLLNEEGQPYPGVHFVNYKLGKAVAKCPYYGDNSFWAFAEQADFKHKMKFLRENIEEEKKKALETSKIIRQKFSWENVIKKMVDRLKEIGL